ncbi:phosphoribosylformylglycinamidine cyclo-ligase [Ignicoccus hospitalis KIN4/I]|uniref:phosphoribosylformylglycinamidine cyclo-ligase n=1 Tax=Ignicoccus hospitalis (strain KIN4/I / DSM 18386 / JCM 14125) TaxID=453591 RepID=A8A992_IGNH4|nr:phosphoribosylformylglycinamidine cyclo-ligase [Ignicoccus hospitalis KIN4/I]
MCRVGWTYSKAGVDVSAQKAMEEQFIKKSKKLANGIGGYASSFNVCGEVTLHVDGVGTKTELLRKYSRNWVAGWDCLMVNANDVACEGFRVFAYVDYLAVERGDPVLAREVAEGMSKAAEALGAVLAGGETAIMPDVVKGYDVSCTVLGVREARPQPPRPGDAVIAVASNGPHANGYTLIRRLIQAGLLDPEPLLDFLLAPVANYHNPLLRAMKEGKAKWGAHVTGGAFYKVHSRLPKGLGVRLEAWEVPEGFVKIVEAAGMSAEEAYKTFNMGVGMLVVGSEEAVEAFEREGLKAWKAGEVVEGPTEIETPWGKVVIR